MYRYYEFFAGAGMVRAGLGHGWRCTFANDIDPKKARSYERNWGASEFCCADVAKISTRDLPGCADLAWASFPCQDLSLAGSGAGLRGERSGTFWQFFGLLSSLQDEGRAPSLVVLENVRGALTSHNGKDFVKIVTAIASAGYRVGALIIDAVRFVPQSRPRLFVLALSDRSLVPEHRVKSQQDSYWHPASLVRAYRKLSERVQSQWLWWHLPVPEKRTVDLVDLIELEPNGVSWHSHAQTQRLLNMMSAVNRAKVKKARRVEQPVVGTIYKRTRRDSEGKRRQRAEVRFDGVAGCLRTPQGGSSRQTIMIVDGSEVRSRLLSPRETARLMGLPEEYKLPTNYNEAYHLSGDGVVVPVVRYLAAHVLEPVLVANKSTHRVAA